jgi:acyl-CoA dehydrogenase
VDFAIPADLQALYQVIREFVEQEVRPIEAEIDETDAVPARVLAQARELGLFGLSIPEEYCGSGLGVFGRTIAYEALGRVSHGFCSIIGAHSSIGTTGIVDLASEHLRRKYLPDMATGRRLAAFALTEPDAGSDAARIKTRAVRRGDRWIISGSKCYITNAPEADIFTVIAVTDPGRGTRGISAFVVEKQFPGFRLGSIEKKMGLRGSHTAQLFFDEMEVPAENLIGREGEGYVAALKILTKGRATLAARCVGAMERLIEECVAFARQRITMGKPIAEHQMIQAYLAEMATDLAASRALTYQTAWMADQGMNVQSQAAMTKLFVTEAFGRVTDKAVQIHGGLGYMREIAAERFYRDARITRIYEGTSEIQKLIIAGRLLGEK